MVFLSDNTNSLFYYLSLSLISIAMVTERERGGRGGEERVSEEVVICVKSVVSNWSRQ